MKIIDHESIIKLNIPSSKCFRWVEEVIKNKNAMLLPPKISMKLEGHIFYNTMPCILP